MQTKSRMCWLLALCLLCLLIGVSSAGEKNTSPGTRFSGVDFRDGLLKVSVENQELQTVMDEVAQKAGIKIVINGRADEDLTIDFDYLPLEKGLRRLLSRRNCVFFYSSGEASQPPKLTRILILPASKGGTVPGDEGMARNRLVKKDKQKGAVPKTVNFDEKALEEVLQGDQDLKKEFYDALQSLQETEGFEKVIELGEVLRGFSQGGANPLEGKEVITQEQKGISSEKEEVDQ